MGGYGSGGTNKTHYQVESRRAFRVDSFAFARRIEGDKYAFCKDVIKVKAGRTHIIYNTRVKIAQIWDCGEYTLLKLSRVKNIDGQSQRVYFICPRCGRRVRYLYTGFDGKHRCRTCSRLNYKSQQINGLDEMRLKMRRIVEDKLGYYEWHEICDCIEDVPRPPKPPYMRWDKYSALVLKLSQMQAEYYEEFQRQALRILGYLL